MRNMELKNKSAYHDYFVDEKIECGVVLHGNEVKSIRNGMANIKGAWCQIQDGNLVLRGMHISPWGTANKFDIDEDRERRLLVHKRQILKLEQSVKISGVTLIPLSVYFNDRGKCKISVGVCRGKHNYDKRQSLKERQIKLDIARAGSH